MADLNDPPWMDRTDQIADYRPILSQQVQIRMKPDMMAWLQQEAERVEGSIAGVIRSLIREAMER